MKFNKIISTKLILNKVFLNNIVINSTFKENYKQENYNFYSYSNFKLLNKEINSNLIYLKGTTKLKTMKEADLIKFLIDVNTLESKQKIGFLLSNKKMYRIYYFLKYYNNLQLNTILINYFVINLIKSYFNIFDLSLFKI